ncbi:MAG: Inner membrane protein YohD [Desulfovibrio sp.]
MNPDIAAYITEYGYLAVFIGAFLEGEAVVLIAGFLAHQGYLYAPGAALAAFLGSCASDQIMYLLGRYKGPWLLARFPRLAKAVANVSSLVRKNEIVLILTFRFIYGVRNVTPIFLGVHGTSPRLFIPLNIVSAVIWAAVMTTGGYFAGRALATFLGKLHAYEPFILAGIFALAVLAFWLHRRRSKKVNK